MGKKKIGCQNKKLTPLLVNCINKGTWPMLNYTRNINIIVKNRQKYLSLLSKQYGLRSTKVIRQVNKWLCQVDLRITAIESIYSLLNNFSLHNSDLKLKQKNLINYFNISKYNNLKRFYKTDPIQQIFVSEKIK